MRTVGISLPFNLIPAQFVLSLGRSEKIGRKLCTPHMIKYSLIYFKSFLFMNIILIKASIQTFITSILEYAVVFVCSDAGLFGSTCKS